LNFPGESRGLLSDVDDWSATSFPTIAFGQGLSVNSVQATSVFATLANDGVRMQPRLVDATITGDGERIQANVPDGVRVVSAKTASKVRTMLESVVSDQGTAPMAVVPGYRVAGKTGTAQRVDPTCGCYRGYTASFIGMAPADRPELVVSVTLQDPKNGHYGGLLGGPVFKRVMAFALQDQRIPPTGSRPDRVPVSW
jgi:cell division protein FtsI (penicillin-binding protein 3)